MYGVLKFQLSIKEYEIRYNLINSVMDQIQKRHGFMDSKVYDRFLLISCYTSLYFVTFKSNLIRKKEKKREKKTTVPCLPDSSPTSVLPRPAGACVRRADGMRDDPQSMTVAESQSPSFIFDTSFFLNFRIWTLFYWMNTPFSPRHSAAALLCIIFIFCLLNVFR